MVKLLPLVAAAAFGGCTCTEVRQLPPIAAEFADNFDRASIGDDWIATDANAYKIENGELVVRRAYNHPLWLARPIPRDAVVELDAWSNDDAGDIKVEVWGDGKSFATEPTYTSTSYNFVFGGWHNTISTLARMAEHGADRQTRNQPRVERGKKYHFRIERKGSRVDWQIDGQPFLAFDDPAPLDGDGHRFFAINDWEAELHFDNLKIRPSR